MQDYKKKSGRMFPTWSEVLEVLRGLGYEKRIPHVCPAPVLIERATSPRSGGVPRR